MGFVSGYNYEKTLNENQKDNPNVSTYKVTIENTEEDDYSLSYNESIFTFSDSKLDIIFSSLFAYNTKEWEESGEYYFVGKCGYALQVGKKDGTILFFSLTKGKSVPTKSETYDNCIYKSIINESRKEQKSAPEMEVLIKESKEPLKYRETIYYLNYYKNKIKLSYIEVDDKEAFLNAHPDSGYYFEENGYGYRLEVLFKNNSYCLELSQKQSFSTNDNDYFIFDKDRDGAIDKTYVIGIKPEYCRYIKEIIIPEGVKKVAFGGSGQMVCPHVKKLYFPASVETINISKIFNGFQSDNLEAIVVDENNAYFTSLNSNILVKKEDMGVILGCKTSTLPEGIKNIRDYAFAYINEIREITLPNSLTHLYSSAFDGCKYLKTVQFPAGLLEIGDSIFFDCVRLKDVVLPKNLKRIGRQAFGNCQSLKEIIVPDSVNELEKDAFEWCFRLEKMVLSNNLSNCFDRIVYYDRSLKDAPKYAIKFNEYEKSSYLGSNENPYLVYVHNNDNMNEVIVHEGTKFILPAAFASWETDHTQIDRVKLPRSIISFGSSVFSMFMYTYYPSKNDKIIIEYPGSLEEWDKVIKTDLGLKREVVVVCNDGEIAYAINYKPSCIVRR